MFYKLKIIFLFFVFSSLVVLKCNSKKIKNSMCNFWINTEVKNNILKIDVINDSEILTYIGSEINSKGEEIFFMSKTDKFKLEDNFLIFSLDNFQFSRKVINFSTTDFDNFKDESIPDLLKFSLRYRGFIEKDSLIINRISDIYDSRSDKLIFKCSK